MAFLGRTARLREFKFQDNLQVGEHEQRPGRVGCKNGENVGHLEEMMTHH